MGMQNSRKGKRISRKACDLCRDRKVQVSWLVEVHLDRTETEHNCPVHLRELGDWVVSKMLEAGCAVYFSQGP
jgi:hypothetical protein